MAKISKAQNPNDIREALLLLIKNFENELQLTELRNKVQSLALAYSKLRALGISLVLEEAPTAEGARDRILYYFQKYAGQIIKGDELIIISGIQDYPRRIRELRVQMGWPIVSSEALKEMAMEGDSIILTDKKIESDAYMLLKNEQDKQAAFRWHTANSIRKESISSKAKILKYLKINLNQPVTGDELRYVTNNSSEWARRVRELRTEEGWTIRTSLSGRPDLPFGHYILENDVQAEIHDRKIPDFIQAAVLERDHFQCRKCGWKRPAIPIPEDPRQRLELHHIRHHVKKGDNSENNLVTLCNICHDTVHKLDKTNSWAFEEFTKWLS